MNTNLKRNLIAATVVAVAIAAAGTAVAATQLGSPREENQAILNDAAKELGVEPSALNNALKHALKNRVDAAVAAGRLTQEQGDRIKQRIDAEDFPVFHGARRGFGPGPFGERHRFGLLRALEGASSYLDLSLTELRSQLKGGKTLAQIARERDKSVDGLVDAMVKAQEEKLDKAVDAGRLTQAERDDIAQELPERMRRLVDAELRFRVRFRFGDGAGLRDERFRVGPLFAGPAA